MKKGKPNYTILIALAVVVVLALPLLGMTGVTSDYLNFGNILGEVQNRGPEKGTVSIIVVDTPVAGTLYIECDKTGRDYYTAWKYMYNTPMEAAEVAERLGLSGYHQHGDQYMPGSSHQSFVSEDEVAIRIPKGSQNFVGLTETFTFYENDPDWITCFYQRDSAWNAGAVMWQLNGGNINWDSSRCVHKSASAEEVAFGSEPHCAVIEIPVTGNYELIVTDREEFGAAKILP